MMNTNNQCVSVMPVSGRCRPPTCSEVIGKVMKLFFAICAMLCASLVWGIEKPPASPSASVKGEVLEVKDVESYTYLRLKTKDGETWAAVTKTPIKKGAEVTIENPMIMENFESRSLKKTFPKIVFGTLPGTSAGAAVAGSGMMMMPHGAPANMAKAAVAAADIKVAKASGPNARTVAEIVTKRLALKDKTVLLRGKVVKYNGQVMGKNWIHLRDGSGLASDNSNDVLVTTKDQAKLGDVVLVKGVVHTDKDFGAGYAYKVLIEEAAIQK